MSNVDDCYVIENLPREIKDRYMELKQMDSSVQYSIESLEKRIRILFAKYETGGDLTNFDDEYHSIMQDHHRIIEFSNEKITLAKYIARLVHTHLSIKMNKIEAEKRSIKLATSSTSHSSQRISFSQQKTKKFRRRDDKRKKVRMSNNLCKGRRRTTMPAATNVKSRRRTSHTSTLNRKAAKNAISAAGSQATLATEQAQQSQQTTNVKISSVAASIGIPAEEFESEQELKGATQTASRSGGQGHSNKKKQKKSSVPTRSFSTVVEPKVPEPVVQNLASVFEMPPPTQEETDEESEYDSDEPTYCVCDDVFYGKMIACDGEDCSIEWFHFSCVGIKVAPRGKWYCRRCKSSNK